MPDRTAWPRLSWDGPPSLDALRARLRELAARARRFEAALEEAAEAGEADLSLIEAPLAEWDRCAADVFAFTGLGEGRAIAESDVPSLSKQLAKTSQELGKHREKVLARLGKAASRVLAREPEIALDEAAITVGEGPDGVPASSGSEDSEAAFFREVPVERLPNGEEPEFEEPEFIDGEIRDGGAPMLGDDMDAPAEVGTSRLTGEARALVVEQRASSPVRAEELRMRQLAESKPYPKTGHLAALLANLPTEWIGAIHATLGLPGAGAETTAGSRATAQRAAIFEHLRRPESLAALVAGFGERERTLLAALVRTGGLPYPRVTAKFGLDEADGYAWTERPASGPLAMLRRSGLAFVCTKDGGLFVAAAADLAAPLKEALAT